MREADVAGGGSRGAERSARELVLTAAAIVQRRRSLGRYAQLTPGAAEQLVNALIGIARGEHRFADAHLADAVALAHRVLDDDNPALSPLWPQSDVGEAFIIGEQTQPAARERAQAAVRGRANTWLSDPRDLPDDGLAQGPMLGTSAVPPVGGWR